VAYLLPNFAEQELVEGEELGSNILQPVPIRVPDVRSTGPLDSTAGKSARLVLALRSIRTARNTVFCGAYSGIGLPFRR
jgi:hypothetical protein